jgi:hypothetical protein
MLLHLFRHVDQPSTRSSTDAQQDVLGIGVLCSSLRVAAKNKKSATKIINVKTAVQHGFSRRWFCVFAALHEI